MGKDERISILEKKIEKLNELNDYAFKRLLEVEKELKSYKMLEASIWRKFQNERLYLDDGTRSETSGT